MARKLDLKEKNPAVQRIADMLVKAFEEIGEKIREDLLKAYRGHARSAFRAFMDAIATRTGPIKRDSYGRQEYRGWYDYATLRKSDRYEPSFDPTTWEEYKAVASRFEVSYIEADKRANESYENARDSFVHKNLGKIRNVLGSRADLKNAVVKFDWRNGYFKGNLQVYLEGAYFRGDVDIKYVIRTIPRVTPYFQYPLLFVEAEVGGKRYASPSEDELRVLLGGPSKEKAVEIQKVEAAAEGWCPMSGQSAVGVKVGYGSTTYVKCPGCKATVAVQHYKYRKHKTPKALKDEEVQKLVSGGSCPMSNQLAPLSAFESLLRKHTVWPAGKETIEFSVSLFDGNGKYRKIPCSTCGQTVQIGRDYGALKPEDVRVYYRKHKALVKNNPDIYLLDDKPVDRETWKKGWDCMHCSKRYSTDRKVVNHEYKVHKVQKPGAGGGGQASWPGQRPWGWGRGAK